MGAETESCFDEGQYSSKALSWKIV